LIAQISGIEQGADKKRAPFAKVDQNWLQLPLTGIELKVLIALSLHASWTKTGMGRCYPKRETIARECKIQVSQVSEALRKLAELRIVTVVRLGRKNIYYVRPVGETIEMPPSNPEPFFAYLKTQGIRLRIDADGSLHYAPDSRTFEQSPPLLKAIFDDYLRGLRGAKIVDVMTESAFLIPQGPP
jgi:hypothetical protein